MFNHRYGIFFTALLASAAAFSSATDDTNPVDVQQVEIKDFIHGGTGCPQGTARAILSQDAQEIAVFFDAYSADSGERSSGISRKSCNLGVGLSVPPGLTASLISFDFRGFYDVPKQGRATLRSSYFFAGDAIGENFSRSWGNADFGVSSEFFQRDEFPWARYSDCGDDVIARVNSSILAQSSPDGSGTLVQVDTLDGAAEYVYHLQWATCGSDLGNSV